MNAPEKPFPPANDTLAPLIQEHNAADCKDEYQDAVNEYNQTHPEEATEKCGSKHFGGL